MKRLPTIIAIAVLGSLSGCASPTSTSDESAGAASIQNSCINPTQITKQTIVSDQEIQFELANREVWVNKLPRACPGLRFQQGFTWDVRGTLVCSNEQTIYVKDDGTPCQLGEFTRLPASSS